MRKFAKDADAILEELSFQNYEVYVLLLNSRGKISLRKLKSRWSVPFRILKVFLCGAIELIDENIRKTFKVNGQRLKHYWDGEVNPQVSILKLRDP